ncbi:protein FAR1-RELATED SEQUENCE 2-like [Helianthus annuus]|uniref:protein FAR1-RELATED SEQUENCE 2-like n=1 Tax=Helianthus annuus TaxID=4232 RepID=UPI001652F075|nr:protein FAR1-RELATED SEQUENCE 2-like [Helianthus annuus]
MALAVHKNGHPRMIGTFSSASISRTTKSTGKTNLSTLTRRFSIMPRGYLTDLSARDKDMRVGDNSPRPNLSYKEYGIKFILAPRLARALHSAGSWKVYKFVEEHNHDLVECPDKHFLPTERHLTQLQKHVIHNMSKLNLGPVKAFNVMKTCFGGFEDVGASKVEFKNYKRYSMVYAPFTGIDNCHYNVTFGAALLALETGDTYIWLLRVFLIAIGSQPKVVVTDQDLAMKKAISVVFVETMHRLCMWHVMHKLFMKVGVRLCNSTNFKERICGVVWTDILTPKEFESGWEEVIGEFNLADNDWLSVIFALRESWIPAYYRMEELSRLMRTTSRSESENHYFGQFWCLLFDGRFYTNIPCMAFYIDIVFVVFQAAHKLNHLDIQADDAGSEGAVGSEHLV